MIISLEDIRKTYDTGAIKLEALKGVNLSIEEKEFVAIMGASGSGKSTLMNILGCLDRLTSGKYILDGVDISSLDDNSLAQIRNKKIGFVFQAFNLLPKLTAIANVELPMVYAGVPKAERQEKARKALERVGLGERIHHKPNEVSGGQKQRIAIARSLVNNPSIILADEPTGNLDSKSSEEIMGIFQALNDEGVTIVMVTHEPDIAMHTKRAIVFKDGNVISDNPVKDRIIIGGQK
ncbi:putative ABC transport system ATP-binding protein [Clostridium tetanomorphum]|uniref:ABC transporter ATP-binding protein n=1 Tax=Clostridium tetanomorphum TaxID=1553 RepID=A0A923J181_CLOTT|nr:ABC transporter ATPase [Clostridium tetanomorphum DSM 665]MBC2397058.1 ABC transporter ATP-binding protein [Clostridium tetanomorphum]KAJ52047.1 ABC transporter ATPase [Clostridium tetanomorphum DSM 665]MBP1862967.1 putative ABC transport system ATP-binding protein [Clostridium tetanomorphum]NRS82796.1 putative ABC transport system ATP-binding protein [Clostridium tetanomorphum]